MSAINTDLSDVNQDDIRSVAKVLHGHTWVSIIKSSTPTLITKASSSISENLPIHSLLSLNKNHRG